MLRKHPLVIAAFLTVVALSMQPKRAVPAQSLQNARVSAVSPEEAAYRADPGPEDWMIPDDNVWGLCEPVPARIAGNPLTPDDVLKLARYNHPDAYLDESRSPWERVLVLPDRRIHMIRNGSYCSVWFKLYRRDSPFMTHPYINDPNLR